MKLRIWCDSGANCHSCRDEIFHFEELNMTEEDWDEMGEDEQEEFAKEIAFERLDWGFKKIN